MTVNEVADAVRQLVEKANASSPGNQWSLERIPVWLSEYLSEREEEVQRFPRLADKAHWELTAVDHEFSQPATFFVALFAGAEVKLVGGRGAAPQLRTFAENEFPDDPTDVIPELYRRFEVVSEPLVITRDDFDRWLAAQKTP